MGCVILTRPLAQQAGTRRKLEAMGHRVISEPLLRLDELDTPPPAGPFAGILLTSAHAVPAIKSLFGETDRARIRILATGKATADSARQAGFQEADHVNGNASDLAKAINEGTVNFPKGQLLVPRAETVARDLTTMVDRETVSWTVYRMIPQTEFSQTTHQALTSGQVDHVLLTSPLIARTFADLFAQLSENTNTPEPLAMSDEIRAALPAHFRDKTRVSRNSNEAALLDLLPSNDGW